MKFSKKRKQKMRKRNQHRINRCCSNMIGVYINFNQEDEVIDQAKIKDIMYLLVRNEDASYAIYKIVKPGEYVILSQKRVLQNVKTFSNHDYWKKHSIIEIDESGKIISVEVGDYSGPYNMKPRKSNNTVNLYIICE